MGNNKDIKNVQEYISELPTLDKKLRKNFFYRGQSDEQYILEPSIFRGKAKSKEEDVYLKVLSECSDEFDRNMTHIDILSKMQHYGVPTRLLDVTRNALVALYFACDDDKNIKKNGCVFLFNPTENNIKQFDSDTISILSSLPRFKYDEKDELKRIAIECTSNISKFNEKDIVQRLLHEIKKENPSFENIINPEDLLNNYFLIPKKDNPRIIRQSGAFIIHGLNDTEVTSYKKIIIPSSSKKTLLKQLQCFGISKATLHPELYKMSEYINDCIRKKINFL